MSIRKTKKLLQAEQRRDFRAWCYGTGRRDPLLVRENRIDRCMKLLNALRAHGVDYGGFEWE